MLCPGRAAISDDHDGIIELPANAPVGEHYAQLAGLDDPVIEINLTPNRADAPACTASRAISRPPTWASSRTPRSSRWTATSLPDARRGSISARRRRCARPLRCARARRQERPVPGMAAKRLTAIGLAADQRAGRCHQFITYDRGRPLHVFDAAKVRAICVRRAQRRRNAAGARRQDLRARRHHVRDRRRRRRRNRSPASWAAKRPAARRPPPMC